MHDGPERRADGYKPREKANSYRWPVIKLVMRDIKRRSVIQMQQVSCKSNRRVDTKGAPERLVLADLLPYFFEEFYAKYPPGGFGGIRSLPLGVPFGYDR